eukprot:1157372-Pelagomonas_calceolata.AAC.7
MENGETNVVGKQKRGTWKSTWWDNRCRERGTVGRNKTWKAFQNELMALSHMQGLSNLSSKTELMACLLFSYSCERPSTQKKALTPSVCYPTSLHPYSSLPPPSASTPLHSPVDSILLAQLTLQRRSRRRGKWSEGQALSVAIMRSRSHSTSQMLARICNAQGGPPVELERALDLLVEGQKEGGTQQGTAPPKDSSTWPRHLLGGGSLCAGNHTLQVTGANACISQALKECMDAKALYEHAAHCATTKALAHLHACMLYVEYMPTHVLHMRACSIPSRSCLHMGAFSHTYTHTPVPPDGVLETLGAKHAAVSGPCIEADAHAHPLSMRQG